MLLVDGGGSSKVWLWHSICDYKRLKNGKAEDRFAHLNQFTTTAELLAIPQTMQARTATSAINPAILGGMLVVYCDIQP